MGDVCRLRSPMVGTGRGPSGSDTLLRTTRRRGRGRGGSRGERQGTGTRKGSGIYCLVTDHGLILGGRSYRNNGK